MNLLQIINEEIEFLNNLVDVNIINTIPKGDILYGGEAYLKLKNDIINNGIKSPIILNYFVKDDSLILKDGHHRLKIANELSIKKIPVRINCIWRNSLEDLGLNYETSFHPNKKIDIEKCRKRDYFPSSVEPNELGLN